MEEKIRDIRCALANGTYYCALALALTLPDICCHVENGISAEENTNRYQYIDWINQHMDEEDFCFPIPGFEEQTFAGEMCYSLRCKVLHCGSTNVQKQSLGVNVDEFTLTFPAQDNYFHGYKYGNVQGRTVTYIGIDYLCERICAAVEKFYLGWPNKADFLSFTF